MKRYRCVKCGADWYTANLREGVKCDYCQGELEEQDLSEVLNKCIKTLNEADEAKKKE